MRGRGTVDAESRHGNVFASAAWASAWAGQLGAAAKGKGAILAERRLHHESASTVLGERAHDMCEVVFDLTFRHREAFGQLARGQARPRQAVHQPLSNGARHAEVRRFVYHAAPGIGRVPTMI